MSHTYRDDSSWASTKIQPIAEKQVYSQVWPGCRIISLDDDELNILKTTLDVAGADKLLRWPDGTASFLAQRFRSYEKRVWDDFTLREFRPNTSYRAECYKAPEALKANKINATYYAYGHVNEEEDGFLRFRIVKFREFLEYWTKGLLPKPQRGYNADDSSWFLYWAFKDIPPELILWLLKPRSIRLAEFMEAGSWGVAHPGGL